MKRFVATLAAVAVLLAGCSEASTDGAVLYGRFCAACHGGDLSGGVGQALGPASAAAALSDAVYRTVIIEGTSGMPANPSLAENQIDAIIAHLRQLQGG